MKRKFVLAIMALIVFVNYSSGQKPAIVTSDEAGWQKIGETIASFKTQDESIHVIGADEFKSLRLKVEDAPLSIERLQVFYGSGEMEEIDVRNEIDKGGESRVFQLKHPDKSISKVAFTYQSTPNSDGEKANVILYGMKGDDGETAYREDGTRSDSNDVGDAAEETGDDIERSANRTANDVEEAAEETGDDIERSANRTANDVGEAAEETGDDIERSANRTANDAENAVDEAGDAISKTASKARAGITDEIHDSKVGPSGQTIYVEKSTDYYYVNNEGRKVYISESQLKEKKDN